MKPSIALRRVRGLAVAFGLALCLAGNVAQAAVATWTLNADGTWTTTGNWAGGTVPNAVGDVAIFGNDITGNRTVTLNATVTLGGLQIGDALGTSTFTFAGTNALTFDNTGGSHAFVNKYNSTTDVWQAPLVLSSTTDWNIYAGTLQVTGPSNAQVSYTGGGSTIKNGAGTLQLNIDAATGLGYTGDWVLNLGTLTIGGANGATSTALGTGVGGITLNGTGNSGLTILNLTNNGTASGATVVWDGNSDVILQGAARITVDRNFITGANDRVNHELGDLTMNGGVLAVTSGSSHRLTFAGTTTLAGQTSVFDIGTNSTATLATLTLSGTITEATAGRSLIKEGQGRLAVTGSGNNYSGVTAIKDGVLQVGAGIALGVGATFVNGGVLSVPDTATLNSLSSAGGVNLVGQLGTSRYALPVIGYSGSAAISSSNPINVTAPIAGMVLGIDGVSGTSSVNTANIDLSQVAGGGSRVYLSNVVGGDRTYRGTLTNGTSGDLRLLAPTNNLILDTTANILGGAGATNNLVFGYDLGNAILLTSNNMQNVNAASSGGTFSGGGTVSVRVNNSSTLGTVTVNRGVTLNINGDGLTTPVGTGVVTALGGTISTADATTAQFGNTDFRLYGGSTLFLDTAAVTTANSNRRLLTTTDIDLISSTLRLRGDGGAATSSSQTVNSIDYAGGSTISVGTDGTTAGRLATLTAGSLNRVGRGTLNIRNIENNTATFGTSSGTQKLIITGAPTVTNDMIGADLVLWGGTNSNDAQQPSFVTYDATHGIRAADFDLSGTAVDTAAELAAATTGQIVSIDNLTANMTVTTASVQALRIRTTSNSNQQVNSGTITIGSSAAVGQGAGLFLVHTADNTNTHSTNFAFGSQEGLIYTSTNGSNSIVALTGVLSGTGGITLFGDGRLRLQGSNTFTGALTVNAGEIRLNARDAAGTLAAMNTIDVWGGAIYLEASAQRYYNNLLFSNDGRFGNVNVGGTAINNITVAARAGSSAPVVVWHQNQSGSNFTTAYGGLTLNGPAQFAVVHPLQINGAISGTGSLDKFMNDRLIFGGDSSSYAQPITVWAGALMSINASSTAKPFGTGAITVNPGGLLQVANANNVNSGQVTIKSDLGGISGLAMTYNGDPAAVAGGGITVSSTAPWKGFLAAASPAFNYNLNQSASGLWGGGVYLGASIGATANYTGTLTPTSAGEYLLGTGQGTIRIERPLGGSNSVLIGVSMTGANRADQTVNNGGGTVGYDVPMTYTGTTTINPNINLRLGAPNALAGTGDIILNGGTFRTTESSLGQSRMLAPATITNNIVMTADSGITVEDTANDFRIAGNISLATNSTGVVRTLTLNSAQRGASVNNAGIVYFDGGISDGAGSFGNHLVKSGNGTAILSVPVTYTGTTTIAQGFLGINTDADLASSSQIILAGGGVAVWENSFTTSRNYSVHGGNGWFDVAGGLTLTQNAASTIDGTSFIMKRGLGTMVLNGTNAQSGVWVGDGVLQVNSQASLGNSAETGGDRIQLGGDQNIGADNSTRYTGGTLRINFTGATNRGIAFNSNGNTIFSGGIDVTAANTFTVNGVVSQGSEFDYGFKTGAGTMVTTGTNTWRQLAMTNGTFQFANSAPWANSTANTGDNTVIEMLGGTIRAVNTAANIALANAASTTTYNYGGGMHLRMASGAGFSAEFAADNLLRVNQGTLVLETEGGTLLGGSGATNAGRVVVTNAVNASLARASALNNGIFAAHLIGADSTGVAFFLENDATTGFKAYSGATVSTLAGSAPTAIGDISAVQNLTGTNSIYAFRTTADVSGGTLKIGAIDNVKSGGVLINGSNAISTNLVFDPTQATAPGAGTVAEGLIYVKTGEVGTISGSITANALTKFGRGTLVLSGAANMVSGDVSVQDGILKLNGGRPFSRLDTELNVNAGASLDLNGTSIAVETVGANNRVIATGTEVGGQITNTSATQATLTMASPINSTFAGTIDGNLKLEKAGTGVLTINGYSSSTPDAGNNTFTGGTDIYGLNTTGGVNLNNTTFGLGGFGTTTQPVVNLYSGTLGLLFSNGNTGVNNTHGQQFNNQSVRFGADDGLGMTVNLRGPAQITVNQAAMSSNSAFGQGNLMQIGALNMTENTLNLSGGNLYRLKVAGATTILGAQASFQTNSDAISFQLDGQVTGSGALNKLGDGALRTLILTNTSNNFSGGLNIQGGDVQNATSSASTLGSGSVRIFPEGTLRLAANTSVDGSKLVTYSRVNAMGAVALDDNFIPTVLTSTNFSSVYNTTLQLSQPYFNQALDMATIGDGRAFLGSAINTEVRYMAATLGAGVADAWNPGVGVYRLVGGVSNLGFDGAPNVLTGNSYLQVGPQRNMVLGAVTNSGNAVVIRTSNDYTGGTQIAEGAILISEVGGSPTAETAFGSGAIEVYGELRYSGSLGSNWNAQTSAPINSVVLRPAGLIRLIDGNIYGSGGNLVAGNQGRWGDAQGIDLNGGQFRFDGAANWQSVETIGDVTVRKGGALSVFRASTASSAQLNVGNIVRVPGGTLTISYNSGFLGTNLTTPLSYERVTATQIDGAAITRGGTTTNGAGVTNGGIVAPWIIDSTANTFLGYDPTGAGTGFQPLLGSFSLTGVATTNANATVTVASSAGLVVGMSIFGPNIPAGATITGIANATSITISANATANATGQNATATRTAGAGEIAFSKVVTGNLTAGGLVTGDTVDLALNGAITRTLADNPTMYALRTAQDIRPTASFNTITLESGGLIGTGGTINPTGSITTGVVSPMTVNFGAGGAGEALLYISGTTVMQARIAAAAGLTKFGGSTLELRSLNPGLTGAVTINNGTLLARVGFSGDGTALAANVFNGQDVILNAGTLQLEPYMANAAGTATEIASNVRATAILNSNIFVRGDSTLGNNGQAQYVRIGNLTFENGGGAAAMNGNGVIALALQSGLWINGTTTLIPQAVFNSAFSGFAQSTFAGQITGAADLEKFGNGTMTFLNAGNNYSGGTIVHGTTNATTVSVVASGVRGTGTPFGTGAITVNPGGLLRVADNANIASNVVNLYSDGIGLAGLGIAHNGVLPTITTGAAAAGQVHVETTGPFAGVLTLDYGYYSQNLNMASLPGGDWWLGNSTQAETFYFNQGIGAAAGGKYLLGGGGNQSGISFGGVLVSGGRQALFENLFSGGSANDVRIEVGAMTAELAANGPSFVNGNSGYMALLTRNTTLTGDVRVNANSTLSIGNNFALGSGRLVLNGGGLRYDFNTNNFVTGNITLDNNVVLQGDFSTSQGNELVLNGNVAMGPIAGVGATRVWNLTGSGLMAVGLTAGSTTNGVISGGDGSNLIKRGSQVVSFRANNTYLGYTQIERGEIVVAGDVLPGQNGPLGNNTSPILLAVESTNNAGSLGIGGKFTIGRDILVTSAPGTGLNLIEARTNETAYVTGGISVATGATVTLGGLGSSNGLGIGGALVITGPISGAGAVAFGTGSTAPNANGPVSLMGLSNGYSINTYAGGTTFNTTRVEIGGDTLYSGPATNPTIISGPFGTGAMTWTSGENTNGATFLAVGGPRTIVNAFNATSSAANATWKFAGNQALTFVRDWNTNSDSSLRNRTLQVINPYQPTTFSGALSASSAAGINFLKTGSGLLVLGGANTFANLSTSDANYGTGVFIDSGILRVNADAALGNATNLAAAQSHLLGPADIRLRGGVLSAAASFTSARQIIFVATSGAAASGGIDVAAGQTLTLTAATKYASGTTSMTLTKTGQGTLALNNNSNVQTTLVLGGAQQLGPNVGLYSHTGGTVSTTATTNSPFVVTAGTVTIHSGTLSLIGGGAAQALSIGTLNYGAAGSVALSQGTTSSTLTIGTALTRQNTFNSVNYGTLTINPSSLGNLGSTEKVIVSAGAPANTTVGAGSVLTVPSIFVALAGSGQDANFARYDSTNGLMVHTGTTVTTLGTTNAAAVADVSSSDVAGAGNIDTYALRTSADIAPTDGTTLVRINSGGLILNGAAGPVISANTLFGTGTGSSLKEAIVYVRDGQTGPAYSAISGNVTALDFTKTGAGTLELSGASNQLLLGSTLTRLPVLSVQNGTFRFANTGAQFTNAARPAAVNSFLGNYALNVNESGVFDLNGLDTAVGALTGNGTVTSNVAGSVNFIVRNGYGVDPTFSGQISNGSGSVSFTKGGAGILTMTGYGAYTGGTTVEGGRVIAGTGAVGNSAAGVLGRLEAQTVLALGTGPITLAGGDLRLNAATLLNSAQTTSEVIDGYDGLLFGGPNGYDVTVSATSYASGVALPSNTTSVLRAASQNAIINSLTINAPQLTSTEGLTIVKGASTFTQADTVLRMAGGRIFFAGQINAAGHTITKTGANDIVLTHTESGVGQNTVGLWKVYGGILNPRTADGASNPLGANATVELNGGSTSYGLLLTSDGDGTAAAERVMTYADTTIRFGSALSVSSGQFVSSGSSRLATDRVLGNNDDKTIVVKDLQIRGDLGGTFAYFLSSNSSSIWIDGTTDFVRDFHFQADGTATTFNGVISGNGTLSRRSNGATVYFNAENTYNGGTFFTGGGRNLFGSYEGNQVTLSNTAKLGTGHVFLSSLAFLQINDAGNLRTGQNIYAGSNLSFATTLSLASDLSLEQIRFRALGLGGIQNSATDYYLNATNPSSGVLALGTIYTQALDMRTLGDGMWFLGSATNMVGANGSYDAATLRPGLADTYRIGAGGATLFFGSNGNANILTDYDTASNVIVGAPMTAQNSAPVSGATGTVVLLGNQNYTGSTTVNRSSTLDFRGTLTTSGIETYGVLNVAGEAGTFINPNTGNNIPVTLRPGSTLRFDNTTAGVLPTTATEGRWQDSVGINLNDVVLRLQGNAAVEVIETVGAITANSGGNRIEVVRGVHGRGTELRTPSITRVNFGTVQFNHNGSQLGADERVILTGGAPTISNGMVAPWMLSASDNQFVTYNSDTGFTLAGFDVVNAGGTTAANLTYTNNRVLFNNVTTTIGTGFDITAYALRIDNDVTLASAANDTASANRLILTSGGLISNSTRSITAGLWAGALGKSELLLYNNGTTTIGDYSNPNTSGKIAADSITKFGGGTLVLVGSSNAMAGDIRIQQGAVTLDYRNTGTISVPDTITTIGGTGGNVVFQGAGTTLNLRVGQDNFNGVTASFAKGLVLGDYIPTATVNIDRSAGNINTKTAILTGGITFGASNGDVGQVLRLDMRNSYNLAVHGTTTLNGRSSLAVEDGAYANTPGSTVYLRGQVTGNGMLIKGPSDSKSRILELDYINGVNDYTSGTVLQGGTLRVLARSTNAAANTATNLVAGGIGNGDITVMQGTLDLRVDDAGTGAADADVEFVRYTSGTGAGQNLFVNGSTSINVDRNVYTGTYMRSGNTVTAVLPGGAGFVNNQSITVSTGANAGNYTLTSVSGNTITYTDSAGTATGGTFVATNNSGSNKMITFNNMTIGSQILTLTGGNGYGMAVAGATTLLGNAMINNVADLVLGGGATAGAINSITTDGGAIILNKINTGTLWINSANPNLAANVYINAGLLAFGNRANTAGNPTANLGAGDIYVNPGASIHVRDMANINTSLGQQVILTGTPYSASVFRSAGAFTQAQYQSLIASGASGSNQVAVLALEANNNNSLDLSTIGDGRLYLGANGDRTYGAASIAPGLANLANSVIGGTSANPVYRFTHTVGNTLIINLSSGGIGNLGGTTATDVQIGNQAILGPGGNWGSNGYVSFQDQNTYTGQTVVARSITLRLYTSMNTGDAAGPLGSNAIAPIDIYGGLRIEAGGSLRNVGGTANFYSNVNFHPTSVLTFQDMTATGASSNRWDDSTAINLDGSTIVAEATNNADNNGETVGAITFDRGSRIALSAEGTGDAFLTAASLARASASAGAGTGRGTLVFTPSATANFGAAASTGVAQTQFKTTTAITASATSAVAGMLPGYYVESNGNRFVKNGTNGVTPVVDGDMVAFTAGMTAGTAVVNVTANTSLPDFNPVIYALRGGNVTLSSPTGTNNDATITFGGSGADVGSVISTANTFTINPNLKFGATGMNEALFYAGGNMVVNGNIIAGSITKFGTAELRIGNDQSDLARGTGNGYQSGWVVNEGSVRFDQFGSAGNAVLGNTIALNGSQASSATLFLRAQPADTLLNYTYTSGKIYAVDFATIDWDPGADDRVHTIADIEIQQSGGIGNAPINGTLDAYLRVANNRNRSILAAGTLTVASNAILNVDTTASSATYAATSTNSAYLTNSISSGMSVASLSGSNRLTKWGDGTLYIRGDSSSTFSGAVVIDQGAVFVTNNGSLGTGAVTVNRYGTLEVGVANYAPTNSSITYNEGSIERWSVDNARSGNLNLGKATLQLSANQPTTSATITLNGGGIQAYANADGSSNAQASGGVLRILNPNVTINLAGDSFLGDRNYEGANGLDSGKQVHDYKPMEEYLASGAILEIQGVIGGTGGLTKVGYDTVILSGGNTYSGGTRVIGGKLMLGRDNALSDNGALSTTSNGVLDLNGQNQTIGMLDNVGVTATGPNSTSGFITNSATTVKTLTVGNGATGTFTYAGLVQHNVSLAKTGAGTLVLVNNNTYLGDTVIQGGALRAAFGAGISPSSNLVFDATTPASNAIGAALETIVTSGDVALTTSVGFGAGQVRWTSAGSGGFAAYGSAGSFKLSVNLNGLGTPATMVWGGTPNFASSGELILGSLTANREVDFTNPIDLNGGNRTVRVIDNGSETADVSKISSVISGSGAASQLTKEGTGTLVLTNSSTYGGATNINAGSVLISGGNNRLPTGTAVVIANDATAVLDLNSNNQTIGSLAGVGPAGSVALGSGTLTVSGSANTVFAGTIGGDGRVVRTGSGKLDLTNANSYTGGTDIDGGTLAVNNISGSATGTGTVTVNVGGTLQGVGSVGGVVNVVGGTVAPGNSAGTLTVNNNVSFTGGTLAIELSSTAYDQLKLTGGTLGLGSTALLSLSALDTLPTSITYYWIINGAGSLSGAFSNVVDNGAAGTALQPVFGSSFSGYSLYYNANQGTGGLAGGNDVVITNVPEPSTIAMFGGMGLIGLGIYWRRRQREKARRTAYAQYRTSKQSQAS